MNFKRLLFLLVLGFTVLGGSVCANGQAENNTYNTPPKESSEAAKVEGGKKEEGGKLDIAKVIFGHISDAHEWHLFTLNHPGGEPTHVSMPLPVVIYHSTKGLMIFSSSKIAEGESYEGVHLQKDMMKEHIISDDGAKLYDFSITKNVLSMLIGVTILLVVLTKASKKYAGIGAMKAPSGMQNFIEMIILFLRDEVAIPYLGKEYKKYMPLLLTTFFFIWINNLLGLLPGGANFTGNIAVTSCLALISFIVILAKSRKHFWSHLLNPPGVPGAIKPMLVLIEVASLFIKPMALMIRLFANMMAGHIVILALISMIFIFAALNTFVGAGFVPVSLAFTIFIFFLELLVGAIQAFIFTNLTAVFIGQSIEEGHGEHEAHDSHEAHAH